MPLGFRLAHELPVMPEDQGGAGMAELQAYPGRIAALSEAIAGE